MIGTVPRDFTFAVPGDWVRIRVADADEQRQDIADVARAVTRGRADRDRSMPTVAQLLTDAVGGHRTGWTVEVHLPVGRGRPVACALAVDVVPPQAAPGDDMALRAAFLASGGRNAQADLAQLAGGPVPRVRRRVSSALPDGSAVESHLVQYQHLVPGGGFVLLSFSTPQLQLVEPLETLFDAVAGSFRWVP